MQINRFKGDIGFSESHLEEDKAKLDPSFLETVSKISKFISEHLEKEQEEWHLQTIEVYERILKRCNWSISHDESLTTEIKNALRLFADQDLDEPDLFEKLISWSHLEVNQPSLHLFNKKFAESSSYSREEIEEYLEQTHTLLKESNNLYSNEEIRNYVKILVNHFRYFDTNRSEKVEPLLIYLTRTNYRQFLLVIQTALAMQNESSANFVTSLIPKPLSLIQRNHIAFLDFDHSNTVDLSCLHIRDAFEAVLRNSSHFYSCHFVDLIFQLILEKNAHAFIQKIFGTSVDQNLLYDRLLTLLREIIEKNDEKQSLRVRYLIELILNNSRLATLFHQKTSEITSLLTSSLSNNSRQNSFSTLSSIYYNRSLSSIFNKDLLYGKQRSFSSIVLSAYHWDALPESIKIRVDKQIFNPMLYYLDRFIDIANGEIQEKILHIFLNLIDHQDEDLIIEFSKFQEEFKGVNRLIKIFIGRFNHEKIFEGQARRFLSFILTQLSNISEIRGKSHKKLKIIEKILNACLEIKLEYIGVLSKKEVLQILYNKISHAFENIQNFESLQGRADSFEKSFSHLLFAQLYSDDDFKEWFNDENPQIDSEKKQNILRTLESKRKFIEERYHEELKREGFEYIHNNQIGALALIGKCIKTENVFLKLGTGQGKSLIAEMSAIHLLNSENPPQRVFIFTSYDHLAKRDCAGMKFLSHASGWPSVYISSNTSFSSEERNEIKTAKILHIDSENFHSFLSKNLGEILDKKQTCNDFIDIFFNQEKCAVILDEGDLLILDDPGNGRIHNFQTTFGLNRINMATEEASFNRLIGLNIINSLNANFSNCYSRWYTKVANDLRTSTSETHEASGKKSSFAASFSNRVSKGIYQFQVLPFNFSAFVRSFRDVLFLSGSINEKHVEIFKDYFTNQKSNFYANIPLFFGSHNFGHNLVQRKRLGNLSEANWYKNIKDDLLYAISEGQPVLLFASSEESLEKIKRELRKNSEISATKWITITDETSLQENEKRIGARNTITFATTICGRGIDIKISKDIEWGLHVLVTKLPNNYNDRLLTQMIGRTARLDRKGTVSIIVQDDILNFEEIAENNMKKSLVNKRLDLKSKELELSKLFFLQLKRNYSSDSVKRWLVFLEILWSNEIDLSDENVFEKAKKFILGEI